MRFSRVVHVAVGLSVVLAAGCATAAPPAGPPGGSTPKPPMPDSRRATVEEADRLLALFSVPSPATRLSSPPPALSGPALGSPMSDSLVMATRYWHVALSVPEAVDWIRTHPPKGLNRTGSSTSGGPEGVTATGFQYADNRTSDAWTDAELQIAVTSAAGGSDWRVDAMALWRDQDPVRVTTTGGMRVTVQGGCPSHDRDRSDVRGGSAAPIDALLPPGAPTAALICAYDGGNGTAFTLHRHARLGPEKAQRLARLAGGIGLWHTNGTVTSCPADDGAATIVAFAYPGGRDVALWTKTSGCPSISNGRITAGFAIGGDSVALSRFSQAVAGMLPA